MATSSVGAPLLARRALDLERSAIREVFDAANKLPDAIRLEIGEPSFVTPRFIIDAAFEAATEGWTGYTPNGGYPVLRDLIARKLEHVNGYTVDPECVVVTPGAMNALFSIYLSVLESGDEVLLPTPGFPNMDELVRLLGGKPVFYRLERSGGYLPPVAEIERLTTARTKAIFVNTPGNPTGAVFPEATMRELAELAAERGVWLISDEVYDELVLDDELRHVSAARVPGAPVVSVYSFSKVYAMTGWRIGYCAAPPQLAALLRKLQEPQVSCPSAISQKAAEAALRGPHDEIEAMRLAYRRRRDRAVAVAAELGLDVFRTQGTFYMLVNVTASGLSARDFTMRLLDDLRVAVAPGDVFGPGGAGFVRISLAREPDEIAEGMTRIARAIDTFAARTA
jgi:aspartate aminotransferase